MGQKKENLAKKKSGGHRNAEDPLAKRGKSMIRLGELGRLSSVKERF